MLFVVMALSIWAAPLQSQEATTETDNASIVPIIRLLLLDATEDFCRGKIESGTTASGTLSPMCVVEENGEVYFTRYYTFEVAEATSVDIEISPVKDTGYQPHLVLREGEGADGEELHIAHSIGGSANKVIEADLDSDKFTLEVSSTTPLVEDSFSLSVTSVTR